MRFSCQSTSSICGICDVWEILLPCNLTIFTKVCYTSLQEMHIGRLDQEELFDLHLLFMGEKDTSHSVFASKRTLRAYFG